MGEARGLEYEEMEKILARSVAVMLAASGALPGHDDLGAELACVTAAEARGYFLPDEEELKSKPWRRIRWSGRWWRCC
jgi:hypothetical protein